MPSRYSSDGSRHDAGELASLLGIDLRVVPIEEAHVAFTVHAGERAGPRARRA